MFSKAHSQYLYGFLMERLYEKAFDFNNKIRLKNVYSGKLDSFDSLFGRDKLIEERLNKMC